MLKNTVLVNQMSLEKGHFVRHLFASAPKSKLHRKPMPTETPRIPEENHSKTDALWTDHSLQQKGVPISHTLRKAALRVAGILTLSLAALPQLSPYQKNNPKVQLADLLPGPSQLEKTLQDLIQTLSPPNPTKSIEADQRANQSPRKETHFEKELRELYTNLGEPLEKAAERAKKDFQQIEETLQTTPPSQKDRDIARQHLENATKKDQTHLYHGQKYRIHTAILATMQLQTAIKKNPPKTPELLTKTTEVLQKIDALFDQHNLPSLKSLTEKTRENLQKNPAQKTTKNEIAMR
jgi:hypothetical protein